MATDLGPRGPSDLFLEGPSDPDAQATITDFIDYTEYLPSDLVRSLTLIRDLDKKYLNAANAVHELTRVYGQLPDLAPESRPDPQALRTQISEQLRRAINAREASFAEASRLYDVVDRHFDRLASIKSKLVALAVSTARELAIDLPETKELAAGCKTEKAELPTRITLRLDGSRQKSRTQRGARNGRTATFDSTQVEASVEGSDGETPTRLGTEDGLKAAARPKKSRKIAGAPQAADRKQVQDISGERSTSRALAALTAPPPDAKLGGEFRPWLRLTDWEMATLRKKMKKNNFWQPSEVMIYRELSELGSRVRCRAMRDCLGVEETKLSNRGMKMNEAEEAETRHPSHENQAAQAERKRELGSEADSVISGRLLNPCSLAPVIRALLIMFTLDLWMIRPLLTGSQLNPRAKPKATSKKRKFEDTTTQDAGEDAEPSPSEVPSEKTNIKKLRLTKPAPDSNESSVPEITPTKIALSLGALGSVKGISATSSVEPDRPVTRSGRRASGSSKAQPTFTPPAGLKANRQRSATAGSTEAGNRETRQRKSMTPGKAMATEAAAMALTAAPTAASRRSKRPAPGPVTAGQDGGSAVSVGRRKAKPAKRKKDLNLKDSQPRDDYRIDEDGVVEEIDPNEPRYCLCGDCDKEWFHLECVGLTEVPSRTAKWYCPDCRKKLGKPVVDGIVRSGGRR
ncbi:predicted protein [Uncinocarpus reesii 1704]|uniref:Inhibitor of growth protein N-terminal histone-binding domain-containing protein n=1 Tax=Uncinocarpus reesii (strain UAMH 1704) TaxID=336963 RepID=C4JZD7_UNCRE|nr:uncharacterized protein UREG_07538 [Uncinocarpus reesii 1704]EEP82673.1 predicted protein [Uncinocarpus reesii 1704]